MLQWLPWQDAAEAAGGCAVATATVFRSRRRGLRALATWTRELTIMFVLYGLWQYAGGPVGEPGDRRRATWPRHLAH